MNDLKLILQQYFSLSNEFAIRNKVDYIFIYIIFTFRKKYCNFQCSNKFIGNYI